MGRCAAPCDGTISRDGYREIVEAGPRRLVRRRPARSARVQGRLRRLVSQQRFEEAATIRRRLETLDPDRGPVPPGPQPGRLRRDRRRAESRSDWEIHVIRYGRLAGAGVATPREVPQAVARAVRATAETVSSRPTRCPPPASRRPSGSPTGWSSPAYG